LARIEGQVSLIIAKAETSWHKLRPTWIKSCQRLSWVS